MVTSLAHLTINHRLITIRPYTATDFEQLNAAFTPDLFKWFFTDYKCCQDFVAEKMLEQAKNNLVMLVIIDNLKQKIIGTTSLYEISLRHKRLEMGSSWLSKNYQGSFYNALSKFLIIDYLFTRLHLNRIQWKCDALNARSKQAMLKLGLIYEGTLRAHAITYSGRIRDSLVFALTYQDWPNVALTMKARICEKAGNLAMEFDYGN